MKKAKNVDEVLRFEQIPNIGPRIAEDFRILGLKAPADLKNQDPWVLYEKLNHKTGHRHDPCVLDTFMAAVDFMNGGKAKPWWKFTAERKKRLRGQ
jgi:Pathogenicity locus